MGFIGTVLLHGRVVGEKRKGSFYLDFDQREELHHQLLDDPEEYFTLGERHFDIDLSELRLAVGAEVLIAEAANDLKIAVEAADHQDLLKQLRRLRQGVEASGIDATGHEIISRPFRRGAGHERRLDFHKAMRAEVLAHGQAGSVSQAQMVLHAPATQVEIAITQPRLFGRPQIVVDGKRRCLGLIENEQRPGNHLYFAGRELRVDRLRRPQHDFPFHSYHVLRPSLLRLVVRLAAHFRPANHLGDAGVVAQVKEDEIAEVASPRHPTADKDRLTGMGLAEFPAVVCSLPIAEKVEFHRQGSQELGVRDEAPFLLRYSDRTDWPVATVFPSAAAASRSLKYAGIRSGSTSSCWPVLMSFIWYRPRASSASPMITANRAFSLLAIPMAFLSFVKS